MLKKVIPTKSYNPVMLHLLSIKYSSCTSPETIKQDVGYYLFERARTWVNIVSIVPCYPSTLYPQLGTPYPEVCRF